VLKWICERVEGIAKAEKTPIGNLPAADALDTSGLDMTAADLKALTSVDVAGWKKEAEEIGAYYGKFEGHLAEALIKELEGLRKRLG